MLRPRIHSTHLNDLVEPFANLRKQGVGQCAERVCLGLAQAPVKRLGLVAKHITGLPGLSSFCFPGHHRKRIIRVVFRCSHGQADNQRGFLVEDARREHQKRVDIAHFTPGLRIAVDPDDILPIRHPRLAFGLLFIRSRFAGSYQRSAPSVCVVAICSPPWRFGS